MSGYAPKPLSAFKGLRGLALIHQPMLNKGTAFSEGERDRFGLHGLLPPYVGTLDQQVERRMRALRAIATVFQRYAFLRDLQDVNETLFYAVLTRHIAELLPLVYTPTVGEGCQRFSEIWRKPRGIFLSYPNRHRMREILSDPHLDDVRVIVVSDGERILASATRVRAAWASRSASWRSTSPAPASIPRTRFRCCSTSAPTMPIASATRFTSAGDTSVCAGPTTMPSSTSSWRRCARAGRMRSCNGRISRARMPGACSSAIATGCAPSTTIQGTAAVAAGTLLAAIRVTGVALRDQRIALFGAGSAGCGIASLIRDAMVAEGLSAAEASRCFYAVDQDGLLVEGMTPVREPQRFFARRPADVAGWTLRTPARIDLYDVAVNARPTTLIGVSGQAGAFSEDVVRAMAAGAARPVIFPLSNPTSRSEAHPQDLVDWTGGRALIGTGSPFPTPTWAGKPFSIDQTNNSYVFPGIGLGALAVGAHRISDGMFMAAARALADMSPARVGGTGLLPSVDRLREVAERVAVAVASQAIAEGLAGNVAPADAVADFIWEPVYASYG